VWRHTNKWSVTAPVRHVPRARLISSSHRTRTSNKHRISSTSLRAYGPHPKSGTRAMALPSVCPHQPSDATATSDCGSTCVHVCVAPVPDSVDDDVVLPDRSERPTDQNARAACHYLGRSHTTPCHPRRRPLPLPAMQPTRRALLVQMACARGDARGSVGSLHPDVGRSQLGGGLGRLRLGGASNRCFVIV
jgi:hypothetical protein